MVYLLFFVIFISLTFAEVDVEGQEPKAIPWDMMQELRSVESFQQIDELFQVRDVEDDSFGIFAAPVQGEFEMSQLYKFGKNSCNLTSVCVPLPLPTHAGRIHVPQCVQIPQCVGACCSGAERCGPIRTEHLSVPMLKLTYLGERNFEKQRHSESLFRHLECGCAAKCPAWTPTRCPETQRLVDCACKCANGKDPDSCNEHSIWSEYECKCECDVVCPEGTTLDADTCECNTDAV